MERELFDQIGAAIAESKRSSMFGVPCYKVGRKPFIMFYDQQIVCKLFDDLHAEAMALAGTTLFNPKGNAKPMGNWVQIPGDHADRWAYFAQAAWHFVQSGR